MKKCGGYGENDFVTDFATKLFYSFIFLYDQKKVIKF